METKGVRMPSELVSLIERWAEGKPYIESFSQAVRALVRAGLSAQYRARKGEHDALRRIARQ